MPSPDPLRRLPLDPDSPAPPRRTRRALAQDHAGRSDPAFSAAVSEVQALLVRAMSVAERGVYVLAGGAEAALEAALLNLIQPGEAVVVAVTGPGGEGLAHRAERAGADVVRVEQAFGAPVEPARVEAALWARGARLFAMHHADATTGAIDDPAPLCALARAHGALGLVDCSATLGAEPVDARGWGAGVIVGGGAEGLGAPAGVAVLGLSTEAQAVLAERRSPPFTWALDLTRAPGAASLPPSLVFALREGLSADLPAGIGAHRRLGQAFEAALPALDLRLAVVGARRAPAMCVALAPTGVDVERVRQDMRARYGVEVGAYAGPAGEGGWRLGWLGAELGLAEVKLVVLAFGEALAGQGFPCDLASALSAVERATDIG